MAHEARADFTEAIRLADLAGAHTDAGIAHYALGRMHALAGEWLAATEQLAAAARGFHCAGHEHLEVVARHALHAVEARRVGHDALPEISDFSVTAESIEPVSDH